MWKSENIKYAQIQHEEHTKKAAISSYSELQQRGAVYFNIQFIKI